MVGDEPQEVFELTWGDSARVRPGAPAAMRPGALAAIVGVGTVDRPEQASELGVVLGSNVYTIEFVDGSDAEVPEVWLERVVGDGSS